MREIKFRAWHKEFCRMINIEQIYHRFSDSSPLGIREAGKCFRVPEDAELMQYTGLKDKNGKEIYEGDIVKGNSCVCCGSEPDILEVKYKDFSNPYSEGIGFAFWATDQLEVIGNICENPELLKEAK